MMYKIIANSVTVNGNTYHKGQEVSGVRFSSSQVEDLTASKSIEAIEVAPVVEPTLEPTPTPEPSKKK